MSPPTYFDGKELQGSFMQPFQLLPEELWRAVFDKVEDSLDLLNVMYSTNEWYEMLADQRKFFLFPEVLKILDKRYTLNLDDFAKVAPGILQCRLVCRSWNQAIQNYLNFHPKHLYMDKVEDYEGHNRHPFQEFGTAHHNIVYAFINPERINSFLQKFEWTHSSKQNPFLMRRVTFTDQFQGTEYCHQLHTSLTHLLKKFGRHIFRLSISLEYAHVQVYYQLLQSWLSLTPNLKVLELSFVRPCEPTSDRFVHNRGPYSLSSDETASLEELINLIPLPKLEHLVFLKTWNLPSLIFNHFLRKNSHIVKLRVASAEWQFAKAHMTRYDHYFRHLNLSKLSEWFIDLRSRQDLCQLEEGLSNLSWPVKTLYIHFDDQNKFSIWPEWRRLFRVVDQCCGNTLNNLWMRQPKPKRTSDKRRLLSESPNLQLNLPQLKQLRVSIPCLSTVNFLLPMKDSLVELSIVVPTFLTTSCAESTYKEIEVIGFIGMFDKMETSNIWEVLHQLRFLEIISKDDLRECRCKYLYKKNKGQVYKTFVDENFAGNKLFS